MLECALKCMPAADEEGPEAERLRLYDVQWLDEPSLAQARIGEEALVKKHPGLSEAALGRWIRQHADIENVQVRGSARPARCFSHTVCSPMPALRKLQPFARKTPSLQPAQRASRV